MSIEIYPQDPLYNIDYPLIELKCPLDNIIIQFYDKSLNETKQVPSYPFIYLNPRLIYKLYYKNNLIKEFSPGERITLFLQDYE